MIPFYSKRNQVYGSFCQGQPAVEKHFLRLADWERELARYTAWKRLPLPAVLHSEPGRLITEFCPFPTLLDELERQEQVGFSPAPWEALAQWLQSCHGMSGETPGEGNLRNFLWDRARQQVIGIDLESFEKADLKKYGAVLIAALLEYAPAETDVKRQAAAMLTERLQVSEAETIAARQALHERREEKPALPPVTGIVLAGGKSSRMGENKAVLSLQGKTLLQWQVDKLRSLGAKEILLSVEGLLELPGTRAVADEYPDRGPLGGICACLQAAKNERCLVLSVDVPLVPGAALHHLRRAHRSGVTILRHAGGREPLIGMYDRGIIPEIRSLTAHGGAPVGALRERVPWQCWDYLGPGTLLQNCNTPQEFSATRELAERYRQAGLPL